jgi:phage terminase small subunit
MSKAGLTDKQRRFIAEYLVEGNATQAALRAGYAKGSAEVTGCRMLRNAKVAAEIASGRQAQAEKAEITGQRVLEELAGIGFANMLDYLSIDKDGDPYVDLSRLNRRQAAAIAEVTVEDFKEGRGKNARDVRRVRFKLHDKRAALVELGKRFGLWEKQADEPPAAIDRSKHEGNVVPIGVAAGRYRPENP